MPHLKTFDYNGNNISFEHGAKGVMINATEMARPFGKLPTDFLRLKSTKDYIDAYSTDMGIPVSQLVEVFHGDGGGTWMHEDIAMEFARWLNARFAIWCNTRIKELMRHGVTALPSKIDEMLADPAAWIKTLQELQGERNKRMLAEAHMQVSEDKIREQAPKVAFSDSVAASKNSILVGDMAKLLRQNDIQTGQNRLFKWLRVNGYLCRGGVRYNLPTQRSMELEIIEIQERTIDKPEGEVFIQKTPKITGKGQIYFMNKFLPPTQAQA